MGSPQTLPALVSFIKSRLKALAALAGVTLFYLQAVQASSPNKYVSLAIAALTVLGVHQTPNL